jgi:hypothetical protein
MLSVENLLKPITIKTLISKVYNYPLSGRLYIFPDKNLCDIKYTMENYIREKNKCDQTRPPTLSHTRRVFIMPSISHDRINKKHQRAHP